MINLRIYLFLSIFAFFALPLKAEIRLPHILASKMVLQQQSTVKLWGWANPTERIKITTSWDNKVTEVIADGNTKWSISVETPVAGGPYNIHFEGENTIILGDMLIGEVWVCSGQSNMEWSYNQGIHRIKEDFPDLEKLKIRLFQIPNTTADYPQDDCRASWTTCDSTTIKAFSAVGYYFGKRLHQDLDIPIGLISSEWGGTPAELWTPSNLIENDPELQRAASAIVFSPWRPVNPGYIYNAMIAPLINYSIAGVIWYQGESNTLTSFSYSRLINTMLASWRKAWNKDFPFYYVQIAPYRYEKNNIGALLREAQIKNLATPKTGMVVVSDLVDDTLNIHPVNKWDVGLRLANLALYDNYGKGNDDVKSPIFQSFLIKGDAVWITLSNAASGVMLKGKQPREIYIAGVDRRFYPGTVRIEGDKIRVSSSRVQSPVAVRYQFSNTGIGNLFSKAGLPVAAFRTDDWELNTEDVKK